MSVSLDEAVSDPRTAVEGADIACVAAWSPTPLVEANWLKPGALVTVIAPSVAENVGDRLIVPALEGPAMRPCAWSPPWDVRANQGRTPAQLGATLVEVIEGKAPARLNPNQIVRYEQYGVFAWDAAIAQWASELAAGPYRQPGARHQPCGDGKLSPRVQASPAFQNLALAELPGRGAGAPRQRSGDSWVQLAWRRFGGDLGLVRRVVNGELDDT